MNEHRAIELFCPIRRVGKGPNHHFFGYYNKSIWNRSGRYLLANRVPMMSANLTGTEVAEVGFFDLENSDDFHVIGETTAWNWQMGCQLQWLENKEDLRVIYNCRRDPAQRQNDVAYPDFCSSIYNVRTGETHSLPLPVYLVAPNGRYALCVDYSRFRVTHATIGYVASRAEPKLELAPEDDGIHHLDLETGETKLVLSLRDLAEFQRVKSMTGAIHWVTHLESNPSSSRVLFIHRWTERVEDEFCFLHRLFTMNPDGSDLRLLECTDHPIPQLANDFDPDALGTFDYEKSEYQISHPMWKDDDSIIVWGPHNGSIHYHLYDDRSGRAKVVGANSLTENGHMTYSRDGKWLLSDTYPDDVTNERLLILFNVESGQRYDIGSFYTDPDLGKENRCDLHPRWSPDGLQVCIDSVHEGMRQNYIIDVERIVGAR